MASIGLGTLRAEMPLNAVSDPPSHFFPGKYFEQKAQFYLKQKQYRAALEMFQLSGYWANKLSQYNAAVMLFNGIGIPADKVRGVAWFRIAAESHDDIAEAALKAAAAELTEKQRQEAEALWQELDAKYGDKAALPRALDRFMRDRAEMTDHGFGGSNLQVSEVGSGSTLPIPGSSYVKGKNDQLDELIRQITGSVKVGEVQTLDVADTAKKNASTTTLEVGVETQHAHDKP